VSKTLDRSLTVNLLGASFDTGNLGVSALAASSIRIIFCRWPDVDVNIVGTGLVPRQLSMVIDGQLRVVRTWPVRYCRNIGVTNHILMLIFATTLVRYFPCLRQRWADHETTLGMICRGEVFLDITGGDSFSDIYGVGRFLKGYLLKRACQHTGRPYVLLPQTYGPFKHRVTKWMSRKLLREADWLFARDHESLSQVEALIGSDNNRRRAVWPDIAFSLEPQEVNDTVVRVIQQEKAAGTVWVGVNISGLLYCNGYTGQNEFGLKSEYKKTIKRIVSHFATQDHIHVLLISHVISSEPGGQVEDDLDAAYDIYGKLSEEVKERVTILEGHYDQYSVKHVIGQCDFFLGSRMHATIAALSQCVPTAGLAYSKKFIGVYRTIDMARCVVDLRELCANDVAERVMGLYEQRQLLKKQLKSVIPKTKEKVLSLLNEISIPVVKQSDRCEIC